MKQNTEWVTLHLGVQIFMLKKQEKLQEKPFGATRFYIIT